MRGISLLSVLIMTTLVSLAMFAFLQQANKERAISGKLQEALVAQNGAAELLELFAAHSSAQLNAYLAAAPGPYPLCSEVNALDRPSSTNTLVYLQPDPLAELPPGTFVTPPGALGPNRSYRVQVIDLKTLVINMAHCAQTPPVALSADERFLITVKVSWVPAGKTLAEIQTESLSTVLQ